MNTIAIVEEWDQYQDDSSIDWSGIPELALQSVDFPAKPVGLREEYVHHYELPAATGRRFGFASYGVDLDDDDPE